MVNVDIIWNVLRYDRMSFDPRYYQQHNYDNYSVKTNVF